MCPVRSRVYQPLRRSSICFVPGGPAYAPGFGQPGPQQDAGQRLTGTLAGCPNPVTTSWAYVNSPSSVTTYYAQPDASIYYHYDAQRADPDFLAYLALPRLGSASGR